MMGPSAGGRGKSDADKLLTLAAVVSDDGEYKKRLEEISARENAAIEREDAANKAEAELALTQKQVLAAVEGNEAVVAKIRQEQEALQRTKAETEAYLAREHEALERAKANQERLDREAAEQREREFKEIQDRVAHADQRESEFSRIQEEWDAKHQTRLALSVEISRMNEQIAEKRKILAAVTDLLGGE